MMRRSTIGPRGIPVYIAAGGPQVAEYAGRAGDGFICTSGKGQELYVDKLIPAVKEGVAESGRSFEAYDRMIEIKLSYETTREAALENTRFWSPLSLTAGQKHSITDPVEMERAADALPLETIAKRWIVGSDADRSPAASSSMSTGVSTTSSSTLPATTSAASWNCSRTTSPPAYAPPPPPEPGDPRRVSRDRRARAAEAPSPVRSARARDGCGP